MEYAQATAAGTYSGADVLSTTDNEVFSAAEYTWKQYYANISITGIDKLKNSGDSQVVDFVKSKVKNAERTLADLLGTGLFSNGSDTKAIVGLRVAAANTNTVGGIAQSSYSWWNVQKDSSTTTLGLAALKTNYESCTIDSDKPTVAITTRALHNAFWNLLQPQQRYTDAKMASAGFENIMFMGLPVIADSHCPASHWFFINEKYMNLYVHRDADMKFVPFVKPVNQDVESAKVLWAGALGYSNLRMLGAFTALTA